MLFRRLYTLAALLSPTLADVSFSSPAAGTTISGTALSIAWADSGSPALTTYSLFLCAGGNSADSFIQLATLQDAGEISSASSLSVTIQPGLGAATANAYFLKMIAAATGGSAIYYSDRFTLSSMTGTFPPVVITGLGTVSGTSGPDNQDQTTQVAAGDGTTAAGSFGVAYSMQSGSTRFAPMPPVPSTKITVKAASMQYPKSSWTAWTTNSGPPNAQITVTQSQTFSVASMEPTIAAAANPTDTDMQKFLNRWKD